MRMASIIETRRDSSVIIVSIVIPLVIFAYAMFSPHLTHPNHIAHIAIHEAGFANSRIFAFIDNYSIFQN